MALPDPRASDIWRDQKGPDGVIEQGGLETDPYNPPKGTIRTWAEFIELGVDASIPNTGGTVSGNLRVSSLTVGTDSQPYDVSFSANSGVDWDGTFLNLHSGTAVVRLDGTGLKVSQDGTGFQQLSTDPIAWGADPSNADTVNDAAFVAMAAGLNGTEANLQGRAYPVTSIPNINARNGFWIVTDFEDGLEAYLPAPHTLDISVLEIDGGGRTLGWPQDTLAAFDGRAIGSYMSGDGHLPGQYNVTYYWTDRNARSIERFEPGTFYGADPSLENESFAAGIFGPSLSFDGAAHVAIVEQSDNTLHCYYRFLSRYDTTVAIDTDGGLVQAETAWTEALMTGTTLGEDLRARVDAAYTFTTSGVPTVCQSVAIIGNRPEARFVFGFHGLSGAGEGPYLAYVDGDLRSGTGSVSEVGRIGLITQGVEPSVCWARRDGNSTLLVGFVRSQNTTGYPIRFYTTLGVSQAAIEAAVIQDCPFGNELGTFSPIPCRIRPRRVGAAGVTTNSEAIDGLDSDELHFVFTGTRRRDGGPGEVNLYWGRVTKGSGNFENMWTRAQITLIDTLYFANSNAKDTTNQVGTPSICFTDANTLLIGVANERPAVKDDKDESFLRFYNVKLSDNYGDAVRNYDDGSSRPIVRQQAPEYAPYGGQMIGYGEASPIRTIQGDGLRYTSAFMRVAPESGTADDLTDIYGGFDAARLVLKLNSTANTITLRDGIGTAGSLLSLTADMVLNNARDFIELMYDSGSGSWLEVSRSDNS